MNRRIIAILGMVALFAGLLIYRATQVSAREDEWTMPPQSGMMNPNAKKPMMEDDDLLRPEKMMNAGENMMKGGQPSFGIKPSGEVIVESGKVTVSAADAITVTVMGFPIPVKLMTTGTTTPPTINVGDTVSIRGVIDPTNGTITAKWIRNLSQDNQKIESLKSQIQTLMEQLRKLLGGNR